MGKYTHKRVKFALIGLLLLIWIRLRTEFLLKFRKILKTYYFSTFEKFNVIQSLACFMMRQLNGKLGVNILIKDSDLHQ